MTLLELISHPVWKNPFDFRLFLYLLAHAATAPCEVGRVSIERGQYLRSYRKLQADLETDGCHKVKHPMEIKRSLQRLECDSFVTLSVTPQGVLVTIKNYDNYGGFIGGEGCATSPLVTPPVTKVLQEYIYNNNISNDLMIMREGGECEGGEPTLSHSELSHLPLPESWKFLRLTDEELTKAKTRFLENGLDLEEFAETLARLEEWLSGATPAAKAARSRPSHYRTLIQWPLREALSQKASLAKDRATLERVKNGGSSFQAHTAANTARKNLEYIRRKEREERGEVNEEVELASVFDALVSVQEKPRDERLRNGSVAPRTLGLTRS
jgi:hypothetical protein